MTGRRDAFQYKIFVYLKVEILYFACNTLHLFWEQNYKTFVEFYLSDHLKISTPSWNILYIYKCIFLPFSVKQFIYVICLLSESKFQ